MFNKMTHIIIISIKIFRRIKDILPSIERFLTTVFFTKDLPVLYIFKP